MASRDIDALDLASLEQFRTELIEAGFEPSTQDPRTWVGPLADPLKGFTESREMRIVFRDGWPFRHPGLEVDGLDEQHVGANGEICLWRLGLWPGDWLTFEGVRNRIREWAQRAQAGFRPEDFALDAHLFFGRVRPNTIALVELEKLRADATPDGIGVISGKWRKDAPVLDIVAGNSRPIEGRCYHVGNVPLPPRDLDGVQALLTARQRNNFDRRYRAISHQNQDRLFLLTWDRELGRESLVLLGHLTDGEVDAHAIEVAPTDQKVLQLRAGLDADALSAKCALLLGVGAVGSNAILRIAEAGLGRGVLLDDALLRPGDVVRHAAGPWAVGRAKTSAVRFLAHARAPWTSISTMEQATWNPTEIESLLQGVNIVVEATGLAGFTNLLSVICEQRAMPLVSAALYRSGAVGRVRRQVPDSTPICDRVEPSFPIIPPGEEPRVFEPGCSSPVNNASPVAVAAVSALTAEVVIDTLTGRNTYADDTIDVYRPLPEPPFNQIGRLFY